MRIHLSGDRHLKNKDLQIKMEYLEGLLTLAKRLNILKFTVKNELIYSFKLNVSICL